MIEFYFEDVLVVQGFTFSIIHYFNIQLVCLKWQVKKAR